jgi:hypothetical protein
LRRFLGRTRYSLDFSYLLLRFKQNDEERLDMCTL